MPQSEVDDSELSPTQIREIRLPLIGRMVQAVANVGGWRHTDDEFENVVEDWNDTLAAVPFEELNRVRQMGLAQGKTKAFEFLALWRAAVVIPASVDAEEEARRDDRERFEADRSAGKFEMPLFVQIHRKIGRPVVCSCTFPDGTRRPAKVEPEGSGDRWKCALLLCGLNIDANDETAVRAATVAPLMGSPMPEEVRSVPTIAPASQSRAELLAEQAERDWDSLTTEQQVEMARLAKWCDWQKPPIIVTAENFEATWNEFQAKRAAT